MFAHPHTLQQLNDLHHQDLLRHAAAVRIANQFQDSNRAVPIRSLRIALTAMAAWLRSRLSS